MENVNWQSVYSPKANLNLQGNPALDGLRRTLQQRQAQKAQEDADFTKEIAKLNFNGARNADASALQDNYLGVVGKFGQLRATTDPKLRSTAALELQQGKNQFGYGIEQSKQASQKEQQLFAIMHNPNVDLADGIHGKIIDLTKTPYGNDWEQKYADISNNMFAPKFDELKASKDLAKTLTKDGTPIENRHVDKQTGNVILDRTTPQLLDKDTYIKSYVDAYKTNHQAIRKAIEATGETDPVNALLTRANQLYGMEAAGLSDKVDKDRNMGETRESKIATHLANRIIDVNHPVSNSLANTVNPFQIAAEHLQKTAQVDETAANDLVKPLVDIIPTNGFDGAKPRYKVANGKVIIDVPDNLKTKVLAHRIELDVADPNFGATLQAKIAQEGANVNSFNQSYKGRQVPGTQTSPTQSYKTQAGKSYNHSQLLKMGYTDDQIKQAIKLGTLK